jgi:Na+-transporting NADH:ubiquinone oxidoreductase subunit NqrF
MPNKTLYIPERDIPLWEAAQRLADRQKVSLYRIVSESLNAHLPVIAEQPAPEDRWTRITTFAS